MNIPLTLPWRHREWNSLDGWLLPVLVGIMRMCWILPWMLLIQGFLSPSIRGPLIPPLALIALPVISFSLARWSMPTFEERRNQKKALRVRAYIAGGGFLVILVLLWFRFFRAEFGLWDLRWLVEAGYSIIYWDAVPVEVPGVLLFLLIAIALWLRGALDGQVQFGHEEIWNAFLWGGVALVLLAWILSETGGPIASIGGLILLFAAAGLAGLAVANLKTSSGWRRSGRAGGIRITANRSWLIGIGLTIATLLGLALLIGFILQPEDAAILWRGLRVILRAIGTVLFWIAAVVGYVFFILAEYLARLIRRLLPGREEEPEREPASEPDQLDQQPEAVQRAIEAVPESYRWLALIAVAIVVFLVFMLVLRQLRNRESEELEEVRESVFSTDLLQAQLSDLWNRWRARFGQSRQQPDPFLSLEGETDTRRLIRSVYQRLLAVTNIRAASRYFGETPRSYGERLSEQLALAQEQMQTITAGYVEARYGDEPPSRQTAEDVQQAWQEIESTLLPEEDENGE